MYRHYSFDPTVEIVTPVPRSEPISPAVDHIQSFEKDEDATLYLTAGVIAAGLLAGHLIRNRLRKNKE